MRKSFRTFLLGLLLAAVPFQGFAAAAMLVCGTRHAQAPERANGPQPTAAQAHPGCDHAGATDRAAQRPAADCDACAACAALSAAQMPPLAARAQSPVAVDERIPFVAPRPHVHVPDGLDRPPRSILA